MSDSFRLMHIKAIMFDLGNTLIEQQVDYECSLDQIRLKLLPGVKAALRVLHGPYRLGLLTNTTQSNEQAVARALEHLNIRRFFAAIVTSVDVGAEKPALRMFEALLRRLAVEPVEALMVGNDRGHDIEPAKRLRIWTALFTTEPDYSYSTPDIQFSSFAELPGYIRKLEARIDAGDR